MTPKSTAECTVVRYPTGTTDRDEVAVEEPLEIRVDGEPLVVTMRTPGHDAELAAGFCLTEGVIDDPDDLERAEPCTLADHGNVVLISLSDTVRDVRRDQLTRTRRDQYISSSCGLCGTRTIGQLARRIAPLADQFLIRRDVLGRLPARMAQAQEAFSHTGGLHAAALFTPAGELVLLREDVGRHNAVDKVVGGLLLSGQIPYSPGVLLVSGRVSFELVQKAGRAGIGFLAAVGAPSSLAVEAADRFGMTLVGFLRADRLNVYTHPGRVDPA